MRLSYFLFACLLTIPAHAQYQGYNGCRPTPAIKTENYPGADKIPHGNNLVMPAGKAVEAEGQKLVLSGRILDNRCLPIKDAQIEIWQADPFGKWFLATRADLATPNPVFAGAGRTYSGNTGDFLFTTLFPSGVGKRAPNINIKVKVRNMKDFETQLYFVNDVRNASDPVYSKLKGDTAMGILLPMHPLSSVHGYGSFIDIVLPEKARYVKY